MNDGKIKNSNYVTIQGWMINELGLKGNDLIAYAVIYMFSQTEEQKYNGSLQYLADWCSMSKQGVQKILKSLLLKKLIIKNDVYKNNVKFCEYHTTVVDGVCNCSLRGMQPGLTNIKEEIKEDTITSFKVSMETYKEIIDYMNNVYEHHSFEVKQPFSYKATSKDTQGHINARLKEGYTVDEFKDVIWWGYRKFVENEFISKTNESSLKYFRPSTLFTERHFEEYLNEYRANTTG